MASLFLIPISYFFALVILNVPAGQVDTGNHGNGNERLHKASYFGIGSLSKSDQKELWADTKFMAEFEAMLQICGKSTNIVRRVEKAVRRCVKKKSLQRVKSYFKRHKAKKQKFYRALNASETRSFCNSKYVKKTVPLVRDLANDYVTQARDACNSCLVCF